MLKDKKHIAMDELFDEVLTTEPEFTLPAGFADRLAAKVGRKYTLKQYFREFLIYLAVLAGITAVTAVLVYILYRANVSELLYFLTSHILLVAGINILVIFILLADKVVLPYLFYRSSVKE